MAHPDKTDGFFTDLRQDILAKVTPIAQETSRRTLSGQVQSGLPGRTKTQLLGIMERVFAGEEIVFVQPNMLNVDYVFTMAMSLFSIVGAQKSTEKYARAHDIQFGKGLLRLVGAADRGDAILGGTMFAVEFDHDWKGVHDLPDHHIQMWEEAAQMQARKLELKRGKPS